MAAAASQLVDLRTPGDFYRALAPSQEHDHLMWLRGRKGDDGREWYKLNSHIGAQELSRYTDQPDVFITPNEFYGWRLIRLLSALNAFYVDIDVHGSPEDPAAAAWTAIAQIERARLPGPNMIVYTGRGVHLYWLFNRTTANALPRWQLVQKTLVKLTNGDRQAIDATRVLRVVGTTNPLAPAGRRHVSAEVLNPQRYDFDWLCDQIVQIPRAELRDIQAARARREAASGQRDKHAGKVGSIYHVWYLRYRDMIEICNAHWFGGVPPGRRDFVLFQMANALSWFTKGEALVDEIMHVVRHHIPTYTDAQARSYTSSIVTRARAAADGKKYQWHGDLVDPRYRFTAARLWEDWADLVEAEPGLKARLRAIVPPDLRNEREKTRQDARDRVSEGRYGATREDYLAKCAAQRDAALQLHQAGKTWEEIAASLGISVATARKRVARALTPGLTEGSPFGQPTPAQAPQTPCPTSDTCAPLVIALPNPPLAIQEDHAVSAHKWDTRAPSCPTVDRSAPLVIGPVTSGLVAECPSASAAADKSAPLVIGKATVGEPDSSAPATVEVVRDLRAGGMSIRAIAAKTGLSKSKVDRLLKCPIHDMFTPLA